MTASGKMNSICCFFSTFRDKSLEKLYQSFSVRQKRAGLESFLLTAILFDVYMLIVPSGQDVVVYGVMGTFLLMNCLLLIWCKRGFQSKTMWAFVPHLAFHIANSQILSGLFLKKNEVTSRDSLGWFLLLTYLIYVTLPLRLPYCVLLSIGTFTSYIVSLSGLSKSQIHFVEQVIIIFKYLFILYSFFLSLSFVLENTNKYAQ